MDLDDCLQTVMDPFSEFYPLSGDRQGNRKGASSRSETLAPRTTATQECLYPDHRGLGFCFLSAASVMLV